ncbi:unnamed protein product [Calicophoron daubneyi]|uniref:NADPH-dependent FMN reductase-like domain-containing protein n=1 Tax=Calicophoron daubneyi TaxID=300641 RepID=A0AAV2TQD8_CALDB
MKAVLFASSIRPGRLNDRVLKLVSGRLEALGHSVQIVDPKERQLPMLQTPLHFYGDPTKVPKELVELNSLVKDADILVFTTCEYNRSVPPALSNLLDHLPPTTFGYKPAAIISYSPGSSAGIMASNNLVGLLGELGCLMTPHKVNIGLLTEKVSESGEPMGPQKARDALTAEIDLVIQQAAYIAQRMLDHSPSESQPKIHPYC